MAWHDMDIKSVERVFRTDSKKGLTTQEAVKRLAENGSNTIERGGKKKTLIGCFFEQLNDFLIVILLSAAAVSAVVAYIDGSGDYMDSVIILVIVILNAIMGVIQQSRAEKAIEALKNMASPKAVVIRDGQTVTIDTSDVVVGDILCLEAGSSVCADGRLVSSVSLKAEESALTGESIDTEKNAETIAPIEASVGDRHNMVFSGTYITYGKGYAIVIATGMDTEMGKIAGMMMSEETEMTPLQKRLGKTGKILGLAAIAICAVIFVMGVLRKSDPLDMFMTSVSLGVAAIPEGLPAIVTIVLAIGMQRMSKKNAIIRRLSAVETLGCASIICSDKTGTLTQNKMRIVKAASTSGVLKKDNAEYIKLISFGSLSTNCHYEGTRLVGEATESALVEGAQDVGIEKKNIENDFPRVSEIPFSSERKLMTTVHKQKNGKFLAITKGAPEILIKKCKYCEKSGDKKPLLKYEKDIINNHNAEFAQDALRVLAVAYKELEYIPKTLDPDKLENDLIFMGIVGMADPPRVGVKQSVEICQNAGIHPVMITGDHKLTAIAIAKELGIYKHGDLSATGAELDNMTDDELYENIDKYSVFARVSPEHKMRIVKTYKKKGNVVAMTGDGVNDAPALKAADIGCAMGNTGTDVAKAASDMVITDDNFTTIVSAVKEGRIIYSNIKKSVHFLISSNIGEILTIFSALTFGWTTPLLPIQLLWVNLVTDSLPAVALGLDTSDDDVMDKPPVKSGSSIFSDGLGQRIALEGCMIGMLALIAFALGHRFGHTTGRTMAFAVLSISQLVHAFNMHSDKSILNLGIFKNKFLIGAFLIGVFMQTSVIMFPPLAKIFLVCPLTLNQWFMVAALSVVPIIVVEIEKMASKLG